MEDVHNAPKVSTTTGMKRCVAIMSEYFVLLFLAAVSAAPSDCTEFVPMCEMPKVSRTDTSQASGRPQAHGIIVAPFGLFPLLQDRSIGSLHASTLACTTLWCLLL